MFERGGSSGEGSVVAVMLLVALVASFAALVAASLRATEPDERLDCSQGGCYIEQPTPGQPETRLCVPITAGAQRLGYSCNPVPPGSGLPPLVRVPNAPTPGDPVG
jgi:hypothetical protein